MVFGHIGDSFPDLVRISAEDPDDAADGAAMQVFRVGQDQVQVEAVLPRGGGDDRLAHILLFKDHAHQHLAGFDPQQRGYGILARETSKAMKWIDPSIETIACASSSPFLTHYPEWDRKVLEQCYDTVDYISIHHYHSAPPEIPEALLAGYQAFEAYIDTETALCDYLKTKLRTKKTMYLALDEYASMYRPRGRKPPGPERRADRRNLLLL